MIDELDLEQIETASEFAWTRNFTEHTVAQLCAEVRRLREENNDLKDQVCVLQERKDKGGQQVYPDMASRMNTMRNEIRIIRQNNSELRERVKLLEAVAEIRVEYHRKHQWPTDKCKNAECFYCRTKAALRAAGYEIGGGE